LYSHTDQIHTQQAHSIQPSWKSCRENRNN